MLISGKVSPYFAGIFKKSNEDFTDSERERALRRPSSDNLAESSHDVDTDTFYLSTGKEARALQVYREEIEQVSDARRGAARRGFPLVPSINKVEIRAQKGMVELESRAVALPDD
jgi:hypothetical protein